eukprot:TRINITY_DN9573_c0_g1_i1.p1 TRINITY_DN9573_c0_g1~~TRINITY_DN9573_c0_g1_i1.p1  ORF type:complete len:325 (-),score=35.54 TRINITY_DN9573_c0_g1_i1:737-1711(-)
MNKQSVVIGLDVGSTGVRTAVWGKQAQLLGFAYEKLKVTYFPNGNCEQDPDEIFDACVRVIKSSLESSKIDPSVVATMGIATQRCCVLIWDKRTGKPVIPLISWKDQRTSPISQAINKGILCNLVRIGSGIGYLFTGQPLLLTGKNFKITTLNVGLKLKYLMTQNPEIKKGLENGDYLYGSLDTWLVWKFTQGHVHATDYSNLSTSGIYDPYNLDFSLLIKMMISPLPSDYYPPTRIFPQLKNSSDDYGVCSPSIIGAPIPINAVVGDANSSLFGLGCFSQGDAKLTLGTGGFLSLNTGSTCLASAHHIYPVIAYKLGQKVSPY